MLIHIVHLQRHVALIKPPPMQNFFAAFARTLFFVVVNTTTLVDSLQSKHIGKNADGDWLVNY